jgi:hypothetical protein
MSPLGATRNAYVKIPLCIKVRVAYRFSLQRQTTPDTPKVINHNPTRGVSCAPKTKYDRKPDWPVYMTHKASIVLRKPERGKTGT